MADRDAARSAVPKKADAGANGTAPMTSAPDPGREQGRGDTQGNAVQEAEREQERQLAEGTESPGRGCGLAANRPQPARSASTLGSQE
jgi:hypothetical protein